MSAYKRWFREQCAADGLDLDMADALARLRHSSSPAGYRRMIGNTIANNKRHAEFLRQRDQDNQPSAPPGDMGRAA